MSDFIRGDRVKHPKKPEWGLGQVLEDSSEENVRVFFVWAGLKILRFRLIGMSKVSDEEAHSLVLDTLDHVNLNNAHHKVYVIELNKDVLNDNLFRSANPHYVSSKPCVYVGLTGLTVEERFERHKNGIQGGLGFAHQYGQLLLYELFEGLNPRPYYMAKAMEVELAQRLRREGYAVWQN